VRAFLHELNLSVLPPDLQLESVVFLPEGNWIVSLLINSFRELIVGKSECRNLLILLFQHADSFFELPAHVWYVTHDVKM
jgi:hypothetical protein